ncbi:MAG: ATP-binding protein [Candidatus Pacebacteria bacterium]|nr:ATP-binding protein [Candidatus Paceibacterota bacterium]
MKTGISQNLASIVPKRLYSEKSKYSYYDSDYSIIGDAGIPPLFLDKPFKAETGNVQAWKQANLIAKKDTESGLYLFGDAGVGKSHLAAWTLQERLRNDEESDIAYVNLVELLTTMQTNFDGENDKNMLFIQNIVDVELLVLDDIGAEKTSDWTNSILYLIIDGRYNRVKQTIITTNFGETKLASLIGDRLVSRLHAMCEVVEIKSEDKRTT